MMIPNDKPSSFGVPLDLQEQSPWTRRIHQWKEAAAIRSRVPLSWFLTPPMAARPGILTYHRIVPIRRGCQPSWNVTPDRFRSQMQGLLRRGYRPWPLTQLVDMVAAGRPIDDNVFVVTFDCGYANNYLHALPILDQLGIPATVFLATGYLNSGEPFPFDDWPLKGSWKVNSDTWRPLALTECHTLLRSGVIEFGTQTHTHEDFRNRAAAFRGNLRTSVDFLYHHFGIVRPPMALPYGIISRRFAGPQYYLTAYEEGTCCCLTSEEELVVPGTTPFGWGRFIAEQHDTADTLAVKLGGWRAGTSRQTMGVARG